MKEYKKINVDGIENLQWYSDLWRIRVLAFILVLFLPLFLFLDLFWSFNNYVLFKIAGINSLKRKDYFNVWSRLKIPSKGLIYGLGCVYCGYVNGLSYYAKDICLSYEMLFCPWKNKKTTKVQHYKEFREW